MSNESSASQNVRAIADRLAPSSSRGDRGALASVIYGVWDALLSGTPVVPAEADRLADASGDAAAAVEYLGRSAEYDAEGNIIGLIGLSLGGHHHRITVDGRELSTWCAWDSLFLPPLIGRQATVNSTSALTGEQIELVIGPDGVKKSPEGAVLTLPWDDGTSQVADTQEEIYHSF